MAYIGNQPFTTAFLTDQFSGNGSTTAFTLSAAPANTNSLLVAITGVLQDPSTYSVAGTTLTFSAAPPSGTGNISVRFLGIPASGVVTTAYRTLTEFTATAGQTTFTPPSYTVGYINVFRNGVMLGTADYTASNGTTVVLVNPASAGDLVVTESFYVSSVLNAIPGTAGSVGTTYLADASVTAVKLASGAARSNFGAGAVLQVVQTTKTNAFTTTSASWTDITGMSVSITPSSSASKILVLFTASVGNWTGGSGVRLMRDSTSIFLSTVGAGTATTMSAATGYAAVDNRSILLPTNTAYLDSPSTTSSVAYKLQAISDGSQTFYLNQTYNSASCATSQITALEIAG